jgi:hypothetical protein
VDGLANFDIREPTDPDERYNDDEISEDDILEQLDKQQQESMN